MFLNKEQEELLAKLKEFNKLVSYKSSKICDCFCCLNYKSVMEIIAKLENRIQEQEDSIVHLHEIIDSFEANGYD